MLMGDGFSLRLNHRRQTGDGCELTGFTWKPLADGDLSTLYVGDADACGDLYSAVQAIMDSAWRVGMRPTSFDAQDMAHVATIESQKQHIASLQSQLIWCNQHIEKLLGK